MYTANTEEPTDNLSDLLPKQNETRPSWIARIAARIVAWWRKPRSRIGLAVALAAGCALCQGCATAAWHNYQVAEAETEAEAEHEAVE